MLRRENRRSEAESRRLNTNGGIKHWSGSVDHGQTRLLPASQPNPTFDLIQQVGGVKVKGSSASRVRPYRQGSLMRTC